MRDWFAFDGITGWIKANGVGAFGLALTNINEMLQACFLLLSLVALIKNLNEKKKEKDGSSND